MMINDIKLSICMATYRRGAFIAETLESILAQMVPSVELVIVDGASPDDTAAVVAACVGERSGIRYFREPVNSGVDQDFDRAVGYARGEYCWLMTDDDLLKPGAVSSVLGCISDGPDLVVINSEVKTADFSAVLTPNILPAVGRAKYELQNSDALLSEVASYLSFIGGVVIRRSVWMEREREAYYGTLFIHVGVIYQKPLTSVKILREPYITIRYGNAMWTSRGFEIWMSKWPRLIWSFPDYSDDAKAAVSTREPWRNIKNLVLYRALGGYAMAEYTKFVRPYAAPAMRAMGLLIAYVPIGVLNSMTSLYCAFFNRRARSALYDLSRSKSATRLSRYLARNI